jgi:hypothetical protein
VDGNTDKPSRSDKYTVLAKRSGNGAGGATDFGSLTGTIAPSQLVPGSTTYAVGDVLYAGTTGALSKLGAGSSGQLLSTQGAGAAPIWVTATGGAGDMNGPASATDNAVARFDGTGGKTVQNSTVTISDTGDITAAGKLFTADGTNAAPAIAIASSTGTGLYLDAANTLGVATGGNGTVTFSTASGVANITGHGVRSLTLTGGSSGASLVLGQGATAGNATITPTGTGVVAIEGTGSKLTIAGTAASTSTTNGALTIGSNVGLSGNAGGASYFGGKVVSNNASNPIFSAAISGTSIGSFSAYGADVYIAVDQNANGNMIFRRNSATESMRITGSNGAVSIASSTASTSTTTGALQVAGGVGVSGAVNVGGAVTIAGTVIHTLSATPASASAAGTVGTMSWDANYIYICTATNTWKRVAIATW